MRLFSFDPESSDVSKMRRFAQTTVHSGTVSVWRSCVGLAELYRSGGAMSTVRNLIFSCCCREYSTDRYPSNELENMHLMCGRADGSSREPRRLYQETFPH